MGVLLGVSVKINDKNTNNINWLFDVICSYYHSFLIKSSCCCCSVLLFLTRMYILRVVDVTKLWQLMINIFVSMS